MNFTEEQATEYLKEQNLFEVLQNAPSHQLPPDWRDLARLHEFARARKSVTVLEFGVGRSTIVLADALRKNKEAWETSGQKPFAQAREALFRVYSVDASQEWIQSAQTLLPASLKPHVTFCYSPVEASTFNGHMCHFYQTIPDVVPDFIYLDGPDPAHVQGEVRGLSWKNPDRTVMAADLLLMEPTLLPGTFVIIDGRTNNARFLAHNLQRKWDIVHMEKEDITTMILAESPLGAKNRADLEYRLGHA